MRDMVLVFTFALAAASPPVTPEKATAQSILDEVKARGPKVALHEYTSTAVKKWHYILSQVETGDTQWLLVADQLHTASDASYSEDLEFAVATALPKNPKGVLRLSNFKLSQVCDVPYLEPTPRVVHSFQTKASAALATVTDSDLQGKKKQCQSILMSQ
jgi:hypothetical protein